MNLQSVNDRLKRIEAELAAIRRDLKEIGGQPVAAPANGLPAGLWMDKAAVNQQMRRLFVELAIEGEPPSAVALQQEMARSDLGPNELSRSIMAAREE